MPCGECDRRCASLPPAERPSSAAAECRILASVKHGQPHQLFAQRWRVLEQDNVLADSCPAPGIDLACDAIGSKAEGSELVAVDDAALTYGKPAQVFVMIYP
jgi:hypothetical protein